MHDIKVSKLKESINRVKQYKWQIILICFSLIFSFTTSYTAGFSLLFRVPLLPILFWLLSITCMILVGCRSFSPVNKITYSNVGWFFLFILLALPWRIIDTAHIPVSLSGDEGGAGMFALSFLTGQVNNIFGLGWNSFPAMFSLFQAGSISLFGQTIPGLRILSGIIGALTVGSVYLLGRELFDHKIGLYAAICMVGFHYHIHFSRIGLNNIVDGLSFCLVIAALWAGWKRENRFFFILSGLLAGFSLYFYETSKVLILLVALWGLVLAFYDWQKFKRCIPYFVLFVVSLLVVSFPLIRFYFSHHNEFMAHFHQLLFFNGKLQSTTAASGISPLLEIIKRVAIGLGGFICVPLKYFYEPGTALLRPIEAMLFCLGILLCFLFIRDPRAKLCLIWVLLFGFLVGFSDSAPAAQRYIGAAPICMVIIGLGIRSIENWLSKKGIIKKKTGRYFFLFLVIILSVNDIYFYFKDYTYWSTYGGDLAKIDTVLAEDLNEIKGGKDLYYFGTPRHAYDAFEIIPFLAPETIEYNINENFLNNELPGSPENSKFFVFLDSKMDLSELQAKYPGGTIKEETDSLGRFLFWEYSINIHTAGRDSH
jgi:4-amino-4-deoxy-L-arabinose transferase-like glycosyltransferase